MNKARKFDSKVMIATVCLAASGLMAQVQNAPVAAGTAGQQYQGQQQYTKLSDTSGKKSDQQCKINRCSQLIGTTVENPQGDKLGKIDDVVVDFDNGRVSYCVMAVDHKMFSSAKYLAVPLSAFQKSADETRLILNADKNKLAQAQGFDRNNWPSVDNPAWGAQPFWQSSSTTPNSSTGARSTTTPRQ